MIPSSPNSGAAAERLAQDFLEQRGLRLVEQNVRYPFGEIDLLMRDSDYWVFVEVKYRSSNQFGGALNAISSAQMLRLTRAANHYMQLNKLDVRCRFDVVAINGSQIEWIKDAF